MPQIQLEWNPFSAASRAARAERDGKVAVALGLYARAGQRHRLHDCLRNAIKEPNLARLFLLAADAVVDLERGVVMVQTTGVADALVERLIAEAHQAAASLWISAGRIAAATSHDVDTPELRRRLDREAEKLRALLTSIQDAKGALAELTISDEGSGGLDSAVLGFQAVIHATKELQDGAEETD